MPARGYHERARSFPLQREVIVSGEPTDQSQQPDPGSDPSSWGRVDEDGTVHVRTADGERTVGQFAADSPAEALAFYVRRFQALEGQVALLEQRVQQRTVAPEEATRTAQKLRTEIDGASAVGDLAGLVTRLDGLTGAIGMRRQERRAEKALAQRRAAEQKERIVAQAEAVAAGTDWRNGVNRLRDLLTEWKAQPRLDRTTDDALWHRFSGARTAYTRKRKAHFAELDTKRDEAKLVKRRLVAEAEKLQKSTEWGPTSGRYRDLMRDWKAAGPAPRGEEEKLWQAFRAAQDVFFAARDASNAEQDKEFAANAEVKEQLLVEAEALVPVTDLDAAKTALRAIADRWESAGKVPRDRMQELEGRMRRVEQAVRDVEDDRWKRSNPEARARAADTVAQIEASITDLRARRASAEAAGNAKAAADAASAIEMRELWLAEAHKALADFS